MAEIVKIDPNNFQLQFYESQDETLISSFDIDTFLTQSGYIEFYIYDLNNNILIFTLLKMMVNPPGVIIKFLNLIFLLVMIFLILGLMRENL